MVGNKFISNTAKIDALLRDSTHLASQCENVGHDQGIIFTMLVAPNYIEPC